MERSLREVVTPPPMSEQRPKRNSMSLEEATLSTCGRLPHILSQGDRSQTKVLYKITDLEFLRKYGWSLPDIKNYHCTEDGCQEQATHYLDDPADGLPDFYCKHSTPSQETPGNYPRNSTSANFLRPIFRR